MNDTTYTHSLPGRTVTLADGQELLWFSGTDYLGMGRNETFQSFLDEGLRQYGTHYGSSRNNSLRLAVYEEAEQVLAAFVGAPAALTVSSGMWAGQLVMKRMDALDARYHYAPKVHPALWGAQYAPYSGTWAGWVKDTIQEIKQSEAGQVHVLCTDSVGSPWVEGFELDLLHHLPDNRPIWLIVDDSHGLGVLGPNGQGTFHRLPKKENISTLVTSSLNKALGIPGGAIFGTEAILPTLRQSPWFAGSSPAAPAYLYALSKNISAQVYQRAQSTLLDNIRYYVGKLPAESDLCFVKDYPAFCSHRPDLYPFLYQNDLLTSCFAYPQPTDAPVTRLVITALHRKEDLDRLVEVLVDFYKSNQK